MTYHSARLAQNIQMVVLSLQYIRHHVYSHRRLGFFHRHYTDLYCKEIIKTQPKTLLTLKFQSVTEIFMGRSWYSVLPRLDATISCRLKKVVVGVADLATALVSIHGLMTVLSDVHCFFDPPGGSV